MRSQVELAPSIESFRQMLPRCLKTVATLTCRGVAISLMLKPLRIMPQISISAGASVLHDLDTSRAKGHIFLQPDGMARRGISSLGAHEETAGAPREGKGPARSD